MPVQLLLIGAALQAAEVHAAPPTPAKPLASTPKKSAKDVAFVKGGAAAAPTTTTPRLVLGYGGVKINVDAPADEAWPTWPSCILADQAFRTPTPFYTDVRRFISHPDSMRHRTVTFSSFERLGMGLDDDPHELGELVMDVLPESPAMRAGVQKGWIIREIDGKPFKPTERLKDIAEDFDKARKVGATLTVKFDVKTYFDCFNGTCARSDRFPTESLEACAEACGSVGGCKWWSFGREDQDSMCLLQGDAPGFVARPGTRTGARMCLPAPKWYGLSPSWPSCVVSNAYVADGLKIFADVRPFLGPDELRHRTVLFDVDSDVGLILHESAHETGELVSDVVENSQASKAGVRKGWIITSVNGKSFKKTRGVEDVMADFSALKQSSGTLEVMFDVRTSVDCAEGDCARSDRAPADSEAACAEMCAQIPACQSWVFELQAEDGTCWFWSESKKVEAREGSSTGARLCSPPHRAKYVLLASAVLLVVSVYFRSEILARCAALPLASRLIPLSGGASKKRGGGPLEFGKAASFALGEDDAEEQQTLISRHKKQPARDDYDNNL